MKPLSRTTFDISSATLFRIVIFAVGLWFIWFIRDILLLLLVAILLSSAFEPIVRALQRIRFPRVLAVIFVYIVFIAAMSATISLFIPPLLQQIQDLLQQLPVAINQIDLFLGGHGILLGANDLTSSLSQINIGRLLAISSSGVVSTTITLFGGVFAVLLIFVISFYLLLARNGLGAFLRSVTPAEHQPYVLGLVERAQEKIGRWALAQLVLGLLVGTLIFLGLWALQVPSALALALLAGLFEFIPAFGPILSTIPALLVAGVHSPILALFVLILYIVVQQLEGHILVPAVMRRAIGLNPLTTILAVLIGAKLAGFLGIVLAVPVATIIGMFVSDLLPSQQESEELPA